MSLMQVSRRVDYALRAAIHLAGQEPGRAATVAEISASEGVPKKFLEKILQDLIHAGIVVSRRGAHGGYTLARPAADVSFKDVMEAVEGPIALNVCVGERNLCSVSPTCGMHHVWAEGQRRLIELFAATKLVTLVPPRPAPPTRDTTAPAVPVAAT
ncbi:MAG TPA: Rrf2 family transcriptional regulator [Candidatus Binatia bacterium]|nr:Rrf2 family transcriptional regulator [Candidatus Binatia bacterium]